ncbi:amidophosphoribosyltransferase [Propionibacterium sp. oral taxon 192 str. F0372]|nr:amidophosphoribosyltransferase [Propionibacterium sp. oral taxon 192 str. F0372]
MISCMPDDGPHEECGVFGVYAPGEVVSKLTYYGLFALQHRGQESAGMAVGDGERITVFKDMGLVSQVYNEATLNSLTGHLAVGHTRYSTTGSSEWVNAQPTFREVAGGSLALAHNGNLTNTDELERLVMAVSGDSEVPRKLRMDSSNDTALIIALMAAIGYHDPGRSITSIAVEVLPKLVGAFSLVFMTENSLFCARDSHGVRPLVLGRLEHGWVVASETAALDIVGAVFVREVEPGELITIDEAGVHSRRFAEPTPKGCLFEYVYVARPDTVIAGKSVQAARERIGRRLAVEHPINADLVIPVPDSGTPSALGYAHESGIRFGLGLVKNNYVGRTFIQPTQTIRQLGIRLKLNPLREVIEGKRLVVIDDSIVRGNTTRSLIRMLREAGAAEVHVRIASPPVEWPCFYGLDFATRAELIAPGMSIEQICQAIGADSLGYISLTGLQEAVGLSAQVLCSACFDGKYPIRIPEKVATTLGIDQDDT